MTLKLLGQMITAQMVPHAKSVGSEIPWSKGQDSVM